ncbi:MAG: hypothetical protein O9345_13595 [Burkholderiaceae bacterium]|nr:hypothetical protein [Burkholderiaceae bacterium]
MLRALEELRVPVDIVVGTSVGAIVGGAFLAFDRARPNIETGV